MLTVMNQMSGGRLARRPISDSPSEAFLPDDGDLDPGSGGEVSARS